MVIKSRVKVWIWNIVTTKKSAYLLNILQEETRRKKKQEKNYVSFLHTKMIKILPEAHPKVREGILHMILSLQVTPIQSLNQEGTWFLLPSQP